MIVRMTMNARDLDRYKRLLLEKRQQVLPGSGGWGFAYRQQGPQREILPTRPPPRPKRSCKSACIKPTVAS